MRATVNTMRAVCCVLSLGIVSQAVPQSRAEDIRILRSDDRSLVFEYTPEYSEVRTVNDGTMEMKVFDFVGAIPSFSSDMVGSPDLRYMMVPLGFPSEGGNAAQVIASEYEDLSGVTIAPLPTMRGTEEMVEIAGYGINSDKYSGSSFLPLQLVELPKPSHIQSLWVGSVRLYPIQYNPATRTVRKYTRMVVEVVYGIPTQVRGKNANVHMFDGALLNYAVAKNWASEESRSTARVNLVPSVLASGEWYKLSTTDEGVYVITAAYLRAIGINPATIDPRTLKIFGNGGTEVPEGILIPRSADLLENAIYVEGEGDGRFDEGDFAIFFARSVRNSRFNTLTHRLEHYINHFTEQNHYWLTYGGGVGKRMPIQASLADNPVSAPTKFLDIVAVEEETVNLLSSGKDWFGRSYPGASPLFLNLLPGLVPNDVITYQFRLIARAHSSPQFIIREDGVVIGTVNLGEVSYGDEINYASEATFSGTGTSNLVNNTSKLTFAFSADVAGTGWIDWIRIQYPRTFEALNGNYLRFRSTDSTSGVTEYALEQFATSPFILNVTQPDNVQRITGAVGTYRFRVQETAGSVSEYCAVIPGAFRQPVAAVKVNNQDLRGDSSRVDFIIITSPEFRAAADRLKAYREQPEHGDLRTLVIDVNLIYNEFGGGLPDITAIRDYLKHAYDNRNPKPQFVLFFGQGSYDYKGISGARSSYVPTWQRGDYTLHGVESFGSDDFFVQFGSGSAPSLVTGRINSRSAEEADAFVTKLIGYENASARDSWKMRMLFVGDDGWTTGQTEDERTIHSDQAEDLARTFTPDEFEKKKIYLAEYPTVLSAQGRRKPGAYQDIVDRINEGVLVANYTGHGNPTVWAHESVFLVQTSIPQLVNANKLAVFFLATCNFSQFDDLKRYSGSELLMNRSGGGAIGAVSATRKVYSFDNAAFHRGVFQRMFRRDSYDRLLVERPATAIFLFKTIQNSVNDQKFFYMGDPAMKLQYPPGYASIDTINSEPVDSVNGLPRQTPIQLRALAKISVKGSIRDATDQVDTTFSGKVVLTVNDASRRILIVNFPIGGQPWPYIGSGGTIYRGQNSVTNGKFSATFIVPKDILYADSTAKGRLVAYVTDSLSAYEGAGFTNKVRVGGTENVALDTAGPGMAVYLGNRGFRSGDVVGEEPLLLVDLVDSNGINTSVSGIGHRIEAWVNGSPQSKDITDSYVSQLDDYQRGTVQYEMKGLPQGRNSIRVRAWDTFNNATIKETFFDVSSTDQLRITDVFNYPNPFANGTSFTFKQNLLTPLNVTVKIYTLAGRLIQSIASVTSGDSFVKIPWDGRDRDGDILANGVYLYKVIVGTTDGRYGSEVLGKLSVLK